MKGTLPDATCIIQVKPGRALFFPAQKGGKRIDWAGPGAYVVLDHPVLRDVASKQLHKFELVDEIPEGRHPTPVRSQVVKVRMAEYDAEQLARIEKGQFAEGDPRNPDTRAAGAQDVPGLVNPAPTVGELQAAHRKAEDLQKRLGEAQEEGIELRKVKAEHEKQIAELQHELQKLKEASAEAPQDPAPAPKTEKKAPKASRPAKAKEPAPVAAAPPPMPPTPPPAV